MIELKNLIVPAGKGPEGVYAAAARALGIPQSEIKSLEILRRSVDARRKNAVSFVFSVAVSIEDEAKFLKKHRGRFARHTPVKPYRFPYSCLSAEKRPSLSAWARRNFAALCTGAGAPPYHRARPAVERRVRDVGRFWETGELDTRSNVQFGEGGAGTFSDGKLTTGISDPRISFVLKRFVEFGAPEDILYLAKPHIGTDKLRAMLVSMRRHLIALGCDIRFNQRLADIEIEAGALSPCHRAGGRRLYHQSPCSPATAPGTRLRCFKNA